MKKLKDTMTDEEFDPVDLPIQVYHSPAGYYIGQLEPCGAPFSRLSACYYTTEKAAQLALESGFPMGRMENEELERELIAECKLEDCNDAVLIARRKR
jgi:hypothetical protein